MNERRKMSLYELNFDFLRRIKEILTKYSRFIPFSVSSYFEQVYNDFTTGEFAGVDDVGVNVCCDECDLLCSLIEQSIKSGEINSTVVEAAIKEAVDDREAEIKFLSLYQR